MIYRPVGQFEPDESLLSVLSMFEKLEISDFVSLQWKSRLEQSTLIKEKGI